MPFNKKEEEVSYSLMESVDQEEDPGILIIKDLKFTKQSIEIEMKAQKLIRYIKREFKYRTKDTVLHFIHLQ